MTPRTTRSAPLLALLLAPVLGLLALAAPAVAQDVIFSDPSIDGDERDCIVMTLGLDEAQTDQLDDLLTVYAVESAELMKEFAEAEEGDRFGEENMDEVLEFMSSLAKRTEALRDTMFNDLALFLTEEQRRREPACRTRLTRMSVTSSEVSGMLESGASLGVDPVTLAVDLGLPGVLDERGRTEFERAMSAYDHAMEKNVKKLEGAIVKMIEGVTEMQQDPMSGMAAFEEVIGGLFKVTQEYRADHQDRGLAVARTLPKELAIDWTNRYMRGLYPGPYAPTESETLIERLLDQSSLTDEEFSALLAISERHRADAVSIRNKWCDTLDDHMRDMEISLMSLAMLDMDSPGTPFLERMSELDERTINNIRKSIDNVVVDKIIEAMTKASEAAGETGPADDADGMEIEITIEG